MTRVRPVSGDLRRSLFPAFLTGAFCAVFAIVVGMFAMLFSVIPVIGIAFISGFLGSLFASMVLRKR